jgi:hypothetical protein
MFVHFHNSEDRQCDGCGRRKVIVDIIGTHTARDLSFCRNCFGELAILFCDDAAELHLNIAA